LHQPLLSLKRELQSLPCVVPNLFRLYGAGLHHLCAQLHFERQCLPKTIVPAQPIRVECRRMRQLFHLLPQ
jgi:hypothetical protein